MSPKIPSVISFKIHIIGTIVSIYTYIESKKYIQKNFTLPVKYLSVA